MNRTLRRPMFRIGGKAEGITSGLDAPAINKRGLVDGPGGYSGQEDTLDSNYERVMDFYKSKKADRQSDFNNFLINTGLDLVARPRSGNIFQQVATSAKQPFETFTAAKSSAADEDDKFSQALIGDIMEQMSEKDIAKIEGEYDVKKEQAKPGKEFDKGQAAKIAELTTKSYQKRLTLENERDAIINIPETSRSQEQNDRLQQIEKAELPAVNTTIKDLEGSENVLSLIKSAGMSERFNDSVTDLQDEINPVTGENYTLEEAFASVKKMYESMLSGKKDGGRIGLQEGGQPMPAAMTTNQGPVQDLSFDELRSRLPNTITDDIVTLIASSQQALVDFANIQTQQDVNSFNQKYEVNLQLPAEA